MHSIIWALTRCEFKFSLRGVQSGPDPLRAKVIEQSLPMMTVFIFVDEASVHKRIHGVEGEETKHYFYAC